MYIVSNTDVDIRYVDLSKYMAFFFKKLQYNISNPVENLFSAFMHEAFVCVVLVAWQMFFSLFCCEIQ